MRRFVLALAVVLVASVVQAGVEAVPVPAKAKLTPPPAPVGVVPVPVIAPIPDAIVTNAAVSTACGCECNCRRIRVTDVSHIDPCAKATEITVCDPYTCCPVKLTVCMPRSGCCGGELKPQVSRNGRKVKYGHGKYRVEIHFTRRSIRVDYDH